MSSAAIRTAARIARFPSLHVPPPRRRRRVISSWMKWVTAGQPPRRASHAPRATPCCAIACARVLRARRREPAARRQKRGDDALVAAHRERRPHATLAAHSAPCAVAIAWSASRISDRPARRRLRVSTAGAPITTRSTPCRGRRLAPPDRPRATAGVPDFAPLRPEPAGSPRSPPAAARRSRARARSSTADRFVCPLEERLEFGAGGQPLAGRREQSPSRRSAVCAPSLAAASASCARPSSSCARGSRASSCAAAPIRLKRPLHERASPFRSSSRQSVGTTIQVNTRAACEPSPSLC